MGKVFFIADTHFGDEDIIKYENRPFQSVEEMESVIINNWNKTVSAEDKVYILGDVAKIGNATDEGIKQYLKPIVKEKLNGIKFLVKGNLDTLSNQDYRDIGFEEVYDHPIIINDFLILSHELLYINVHMPYINLFGHVHGNPAIKDNSKYHCCTSVERINYTPILFLIEA